PHRAHQRLEHRDARARGAGLVPRAAGRGRGGPGPAGAAALPRRAPGHGAAAARGRAALLAPLLSPGERLGTVLPQLAVELGIGEVPVIAVGSHDTASAVLAVPAAQDAHPVAYISSGTWSLIGLELGAPVASEAAL